MICDSIVQSKLIYGLLLWGTDLNDTIKLIQKKSIKTISSSPYASHTEPLFKRLGILKIEDLYWLSVLKFCNKFYNLNVPTYFSDYLDTMTYSCQQYNMRRTIIRKPLYFHSFATKNQCYK